MTYKISILVNAENDLAWFRKNDKQGYLKCFDLVGELSKIKSLLLYLGIYLINK